MTDPAPTSSTNLSKKEEDKNDICYLTRDIWHLTPITWHLTPDKWHLTHGGGWKYSLNFKDDSMTQWMNELVTEVVVEQPWPHRVSLIHQPVYFFHMFVMCFFFNISHTKDIHKLSLLIFLLQEIKFIYFIWLAFWSLEFAFFQHKSHLKHHRFIMIMGILTFIAVLPTGVRGKYL